ncbi:MAG TPA: acyl-CoA dehydratase activase [Dehalococcoidales bacterium]
MLVAGVDVGARNISVVVFRDDKVISSVLLTSGGEGTAASRVALAAALEKTGLEPTDLQAVVATGCGGESVTLAQRQSAEVVCQAKGAYFLFPSVRTVLNLGAESSRAIRVGDTGRVEAFAKNDKCAAGSGLFLETMAKVLEVPLEEMGELSLQAEGFEEVSGICAVFAESEVISHIHRGVPKDRILAGLHKAVVGRIQEVLAKVGVRKDVVVTGGVGRNRAIVKELADKIGQSIIVPPEPQLVGALGAALIARDLAAKSRQ